MFTYPLLTLSKTQKNLVSGLFLFFISTQFIHGQIPLGGLLNSEVKNKIKGKLVDRLAEARKNYDETNFNYAISLSDNAGLYETNEMGKRTQTVALTYLQNKDNKEESPREKAANTNGAGELFYASNKYKLAELYFFKYHVDAGNRKPARR
jgi:hypothetical protein